MSSSQMIPVLKRTTALLSLLASRPEGLGAKQLSLELGIPQATCYRILRTLLDNDWIRESKSGDYRIGFGIALLARSWSDVERRVRELTPLMRELVEETGLSAKISLQEGAYAVCVVRVESSRPNSITSPIGAKMPLAETGSVGVMLLAAMSDEECQQVLRKLSPKERQQTMEEISAARKEGLTRSYGKHHPSIFAASVPVDLGNPGVLTLMGWPEDFSSSQRKKAIEARLKRLAEQGRGNT